MDFSTGDTLLPCVLHESSVNTRPIERFLERMDRNFRTLKSTFHTGHVHCKHAQGECDFQPGHLGLAIPEELRMDLSCSVE